MPTAAVNGLDLYYEVVGDGPPVLYIHGGMGGARSVVRRPWSEQTALPGYCFIFYDRRGVGRSTAPDDGYDLPTFAGDALALLDSLGVREATLLGSSAGGPIALQAAAIAPERVRALALANTSACLWPQELDAQVVVDLLRRLETEGAEAAFAARPPYARHSLEPLWRWPEAERHGWLEQSQREEAELAALAAQLPWEEQLRRHVAELKTCRAYYGVDLTPQLDRIRRPVFLVHGDSDTVIPLAGAERLRAALPQAELYVIPGAGHGVLSRPEAMEAVARFLDRVHGRA